MSLANLLKQRQQYERKKGRKQLSDVLDQYLLTVNDDNRKKNVFHPSEISGNFCPRMYVLQKTTPEYKGLEIDHMLRKIFDVGHSLHSLMQKYYAKAGILYGTYHCKRECEDCPLKGCNFYGVYPKEYCPKSREPKWIYDEVTTRDEATNIYGHTDGVVIYDKKKYVYEFKTIRSSGFRNLDSPIDKHKQQAKIYLHCLDNTREERIAYFREKVESGTKHDIENYYEDCLAFEEMPFDGIIIQYMNKNSQVVKEFFVPNNHEVGKYIDELKVPLALAEKALAGGELPCRICDNKTDARVDYRCPTIIRGRCFDIS